MIGERCKWRDDTGSDKKGTDGRKKEGGRRREAKKKKGIRKQLGWFGKDDRGRV